MKPQAPEELLERARQWEDMHRWERAELGRALRRLGWTYGEIRELIPVPKGTLSHWCREIQLTTEQIEAIKERGYPRETPRGTQWKRRQEIEQIKKDARAEARQLAHQPLWAAGVALYWGEGSKIGRRLELVNSDAAVLRLFMHWVQTYLAAAPNYVLSVILHADNDERAAREYWRTSLGLPDATFHKTFIKPEGTGHRKNHLAHGVCRVRLRRSTDAWIRAMTWIEVLPELLAVELPSGVGNLTSGR